MAIAAIDHGLMMSETMIAAPVLQEKLTPCIESKSRQSLTCRCSAGHNAGVKLLQSECASRCDLSHVP